ncbi:MAG: hypothetical protein MI746_02055 [Pseudomonadales bacterium]|nr:hypothetical protein [Pseudomonadales bacterium]
MDKEAFRFIHSILPQGRTVYYDFPDRYALILLEQYLGKGSTEISEIKKSRFAPLLEKPCVKSVISKVKNRSLQAEDFLLGWPKQPIGYRLTIGSWPDLSEKPSRRWSQVTRLGWSLVLQLNLSSSHRSKLEQSIPDWEEYTGYTGHPIASDGELTLAWARIDLDFDTGEALIEEIQSDWVRDVQYYAGSQYQFDRPQKWKEYLETMLKTQARKWPETMLSATLWFLFSELGIKTVFYHTQLSGASLKQIKGTQPPKSLYKDWPKKFCFRSTHNGPIFIRDSADRALRDLIIDPKTVWFIHDFA